MITIKKSSELSGANRFGTCISCGAFSEDGDIFKITLFGASKYQGSVVCLCYQCMKELGQLINGYTEVDNGTDKGH